MVVSGLPGANRMLVGGGGDVSERLTGGAADTLTPCMSWWKAAVRSCSSSLLPVVAVLWVLPACGGRSVTSDVTPLLEALADPTEPVSGLGAALLGALDSSSRDAVEARARALSELAGVEVTPSRVLQPRGLPAGVRVDRVEVVSESEGVASLRVHFAVLSLEGSAATGASVAPPAPLDLAAVLEEGRWRLKLRDLDALLARVELGDGDAGAR